MTLLADRMAYTTNSDNPTSAGNEARRFPEPEQAAELIVGMELVAEMVERFSSKAAKFPGLRDLASVPEDHFDAALTAAVLSLLDTVAFLSHGRGDHSIAQQTSDVVVGVLRSVRAAVPEDLGELLPQECQADEGWCSVLEILGCIRGAAGIGLALWDKDGSANVDWNPLERTVLALRRENAALRRENERHHCFAEMTAVMAKTAFRSDGDG